MTGVINYDFTIYLHLFRSVALSMHSYFKKSTENVFR